MLGCLLKGTSSRALAQIIRRVMAGERVIDPQLTICHGPSLTDPRNDKERELLRLAELGESTQAIAAMLNKPLGTIRN